MKPLFRHSVRGFKGINRKEDLVYCEYNNGELILARTLPKRKPTTQNVEMGKITRNLHKLYESVSAEYKRDLATYALLLQSKHPTKGKIAIRAYGLFSKMLWTLKKQQPEIDLLTITRQEIITYQYPVRSVMEAMQEELLLEIEEANMLTHEI